MTYLVVVVVIGLTLLLERLEARYHVNRSETATEDDAAAEEAVASSNKRRKRRRLKSGSGGADAELRYHKFTCDMLTEPRMNAFVAGLEGRDEHDFYGIIFKHDVSVRGKGAVELMRHFASKSRFSRDQRFQITADGFSYNELNRRIENMDSDLRTEIMARPPVIR